MASKTAYTVTVEHNDLSDEYYIILPESLLQQVGWQTGDAIAWKKQKDGSFILSKTHAKQPIK